MAAVLCLDLVERMINFPDSSSGRLWILLIVDKGCEEETEQDEFVTHENGSSKA